MKKNLLSWLAMATMLVGTGCSSDELVNDYSPENAIQFGTYVGQSASGRASVLTNDALKKQGFGVFASYTNTANFEEGDEMNFMKNTQVTYQGGAWTYSPLKYWPNNKDAKVSFFAYAPYNKEYNLINNTGIEYTVPTDIQNQIDLTWNNAEVTNLTKQSVNGTVDFKFQHALSKIDLTIQAATNELNPQANALDKNTVINVKEVILCGGTSKQEPSDDGDVVTTCVADLHSLGILKLNNTGSEASWTIKASKNSYTLTDRNFKTKQLNSENTPIAQELSNESLMILPQKFDDDKGFCVYIVYDVVTTGSNVNGVDDSSTITNKILTPVKGLNFESGKQYKLNLILGMTSVKVTANVADWVSNSGANVDLPLNK